MSARFRSGVVRARFVAAVALFASASLPACNFLFSLDGYEGAPAALDAGADARGDGGIEGADGSADGDAANGFCPVDAIFCDDFERDAVLGDWSSANAPDSALAILGGTPTGRGLHCTLPDASSAVSASLTKDAHVTIAKRATLAQRVLVADTGNGAGIHLGQIQLLVGAETSAVFPYFVPSFGLVIGQLHCAGPCDYKQTAPTAFTLGVWHDVALTVDFGSAPPLLKLVVDGRDVISDQALVPVITGALSVSAGIANVETPHGNVDVTVDRIVVTGQ